MSPDGEFEKQRVLITVNGRHRSGSGFGVRGDAPQVIIVGRNADHGAAVVHDIEQHGGRAVEFLAFDVSASHVVGELVDATGPIDVLVTQCRVPPGAGTRRLDVSR